MREISASVLMLVLSAFAIGPLMTASPAQAVPMPCSTGSPDVSDNVWQGSINPIVKTKTFQCQFDTAFENDPQGGGNNINTVGGGGFFGHTDWSADVRWPSNDVGGADILGFNVDVSNNGGASGTAEWSFSPQNLDGIPNNEINELNQYEVLLFFKGNEFTSAPNGGVAYFLDNLIALNGFFDTPFTNDGSDNPEAEGRLQTTSHITAYFRLADAQIPLPATLPLLLAGLAALGWLRACRGAH